MAKRLQKASKAVPMPLIGCHFFLTGQYRSLDFFGHPTTQPIRRSGDKFPSLAFVGGRVQRQWGVMLLQPNGPCLLPCPASEPSKVGESSYTLLRPQERSLPTSSDIPPLIQVFPRGAVLIKCSKPPCCSSYNFITHCRGLFRSHLIKIDLGGCAAQGSLHLGYSSTFHGSGHHHRHSPIHPTRILQCLSTGRSLLCRRWRGYDHVRGSWC